MESSGSDAAARATQSEDTAPGRPPAADLAAVRQPTSVDAKATPDPAPASDAAPGPVRALVPDSGTGSTPERNVLSSPPAASKDKAKQPDDDDLPSRKVTDAVIAFVLGFLALLFAATMLVLSIYRDKLYAILSPSYSKWVVVSDAKECANVAREMFDKNASLGDAAVAVLLCMGVTAPHLMGLGGGFVAILYNKSTKQVRALDALGVSPAAATTDMFASEPAMSTRGAKAFIVPGAVAGYHALHKETGNLPWKDLFKPAIRIARNGFDTGKQLADALFEHGTQLEVSPSLRSRFWNDRTDALVNHNERLVQPGLANLLERIAEKGAQDFYSGELAGELVGAVRNSGGILNVTDLANYKPEWQGAISLEMANGTYVHSVPIPGCGVILAAAVSKIALRRVFYERREQNHDPYMNRKRIHSFVESLKFALARRPDLGDQTEVIQNQVSTMQAILGKTNKEMDPKAPLPGAAEYGLRYIPQKDYGGAFLAIVAPNGDAISVTSSLNSLFGSMFVTPSGILLNNYMDVFAKPGRRLDLEPSPANMLGPGKRPMTSMVPAIVTEGKTPSDVFGVFGSAGGLEGLSSMAQLLTCLRAFPLWRCTQNAVRMQPEFINASSSLVYVDGRNSAYNPEAMLRNLSHAVVQRSLKSTIGGIVSSGDGTWYASLDGAHSDGSIDGL